MKKVLSIIAIATLAVLFCGCNKENVPATGDKSLTVSASMPDDEITTKTVLNGTTLTWANNDKVYVAAPNHGTPMWGVNEFAIDPATLSTDGKRAEFVDQSGISWTGADRYLVMYGINSGWDEHAYLQGGWVRRGTSPAGGSGQNLMFYLNPIHQYYVAGGPDPKYLAMATSTVVTSLDRVQLSNLMSIIKLPVKTSGAAVTLSSIKVTCDNVAISGPFHCCVHNNQELAAGASINFKPSTYNRPGNSPIIDNNTGSYGNSVLLKNINVALTASNQYFYIVIFPGAHGNLTFTLKDSNDNTKVFNWNTSFTSAKGKIYNFPAIDWNK